MLTGSTKLAFKEITAEEAKTKLSKFGFASGIGHADTANVVSSILGIEVQVNRINITLEPTDELIVAQYIGPRLPEGATELPEGSTIKFYHVYRLI
jgi:hypothetical protein